MTLMQIVVAMFVVVYYGPARLSRKPMTAATGVVEPARASLP